MPHQQQPTAQDRPGRPATTLQGRFHKGPDLYYTQISELNCRLFGIPAPYVPEMRMDDFSHSEVAFTDADFYHRQDLGIINTGVAVQARANVCSAQGQWIRMFIARQRAADGGIDGSITFIELDTLYHGWLQRLDRERQVLALHNGVELSRDDMRLLHGVLHGMPRKLLAATFNVGVKAIEKRLARVREKLAHPHCHCYSVHGCANWHGLTAMLMDDWDWFDPDPTYQYYPPARGARTRAHRHRTQLQARPRLQARLDTSPGRLQK